jgi:short-subunit dehydrogenase
VLALGEALHDELRPHGVVVTSLCPGHTATGFDAAAGATTSPLLRLLTMKPRPVATSGIRALLQGKALVKTTAMKFGTPLPIDAVLDELRTALAARRSAVLVAHPAPARRHASHSR